jgi:hypothetical protein
MFNTIPIASKLHYLCDILKDHATLGSFSTNKTCLQIVI